VSLFQPHHQIRFPHCYLTRFRISDRLHICLLIIPLLSRSPPLTLFFRLFLFFSNFVLTAGPYVYFRFPPFPPWNMPLIAFPDRCWRSRTSPSIVTFLFLSSGQIPDPFPILDNDASLYTPLLSCITFLVFPYAYPITNSIKSHFGPPPLSPRSLSGLIYPCVGFSFSPFTHFIS